MLPVVLALLCTACGHPPARVPLAVVVSGAAPMRAPIEAALRKQPVESAELRVVSPAPVGALALPQGAESPPLAEVRASYLAADIEKCLALLGSDERVHRLLAARDRLAAARTLFWRVACHLAGDQTGQAERDARSFAALELRMPPDVRDASPDVENLLDRVVQSAGKEPRAELAVESSAPRTEVRIDGRDETCIAPCVIACTRGTHVVSATGEGVLSVTTTTEVDRPRAELKLALPAAPASVAGTQWRSRYEGRGEEQSPDSARLLALAVPARYLVLLTPAGDATQPKVRALLYHDAAVRARAEGSGTTSASASVTAIEELLHEGKLVESKPLYKSVFFWTAVAVAAAAASVTTYFAVRAPDERTEVRVR